MGGEDPQGVTGFQLSNAVYNKLKWIVTIVFPALATFYFTIAAIFELPYGEQVVAAFAALATFGGAILGISSKSYNNSDARFDGALTVDTTSETKDVFSIELGIPPEEIAEKTELALKVQDINGETLI